MPDPEPKKEPGKGEPKKELTSLELTEMLNKQNEIIEVMRTENTALATSMQGIVAGIEERFGENSTQMQNITNLLGKWAAGEFNEDDIGGEGGKGRVDFTDMDEGKFKNIINAAIKADKKIDADDRTAKMKKESGEYAETVQELLEEEIDPEGKPLDVKARKDIMALLRGNDPYFTGLSSNKASTAARRNFKKAYNRIYGLDRVSPFKGSENPGGLGVGGGEGDKKPSKETIKLTKATENFLANTKNLGIDKKEAERLLKRKAEREKDLA